MFLTTLEVADNSGARLVQCIKILGGLIELMRLSAIFLLLLLNG